MLIDTHFHLDLMGNMKGLIDEFCTADVGILAVGTTPKAYKKEMVFCSGANNIKVGLGLHPQLIAEREQEIELFLSLVRRCKYIGEIGLDYNADHIASKSKQLSCFRKIAIACADEGEKILSIHSSKAGGAVISELEAAGTFRNNICIFHWFTGTSTERQKAINAGAWFSINHRMINTKGGQETIRSIPADRILLETDAPFTKKIYTVRDLEEKLEQIIIGISEIRGEDIRTQIEENSMKLVV